MGLFIRPNVFFSQFRAAHKIVQQTPQIDLATERQAFRDLRPVIIDTVVSSPKIYVPRSKIWIREFLEYVLLDKISGCGVTIPIGYQYMEKLENLTEKSIYDARILGWCVEMLQTHTILFDDIFDEAKTRFGNPCWHRLPNVGLEAVNDNMMLQTCLAEVLFKHFGKSPKYIEIAQACNQAIMHTAMGQYLDCRTTVHKDKSVINNFTWEHLNTVGVLKAASCFTLQIKLSQLLLKDDSRIKIDNEIIDICEEMDALIAVKDDYLDVYGPVADNGTDIEEGKCSWLAVTALHRCNEAQREFFVKNYASYDPENVQNIKQLYDDLLLPQVYQEYRTNAIEGLLKRIEQLPSEEVKSYLGVAIRYFNCL